MTDMDDLNQTPKNNSSKCNELDTYGQNIPNITAFDKQNRRFFFVEPRTQSKEKMPLDKPPFKACNQTTRSDQNKNEVKKTNPGPALQSQSIPTERNISNNVSAPHVDFSDVSKSSYHPGLNYTGCIKRTPVSTNKKGHSSYSQGGTSDSQEYEYINHRRPESDYMHGCEEFIGLYAETSSEARAHLRAQVMDQQCSNSFNFEDSYNLLQNEVPKHSDEEKPINYIQPELSKPKSTNDKTKQDLQYKNLEVMQQWNLIESVDVEKHATHYNSGVTYEERERHAQNESYATGSHQYESNLFPQEAAYNEGNLASVAMHELGGEDSPLLDFNTSSDSSETIFKFTEELLELGKKISESGDNASVLSGIQRLVKYITANATSSKVAYADKDTQTEIEHFINYYRNNSTVVKSLHGEKGSGEHSSTITDSERKLLEEFVAMINENKINLGILDFTQMSDEHLKIVFDFQMLLMGKLNSQIDALHSGTYSNAIPVSSAESVTEAPADPASDFRPNSLNYPAINIFETGYYSLPSPPPPIPMPPSYIEKEKAMIEKENASGKSNKTEKQKQLPSGNTQLQWNLIDQPLTEQQPLTSDNTEVQWNLVSQPPQNTEESSSSPSKEVHETIPSTEDISTPAAFEQAVGSQQTYKNEFNMWDSLPNAILATTLSENVPLTHSQNLDFSITPDVNYLAAKYLMEQRKVSEKESFKAMKEEVAIKELESLKAQKAVGQKPTFISGGDTTFFTQDYRQRHQITERTECAITSPSQELYQVPFQTKQPNFPGTSHVLPNYGARADCYPSNQPIRHLMNPGGPPNFPASPVQHHSGEPVGSIKPLTVNSSPQLLQRAVNKLSDRTPKAMQYYAGNPQLACNVLNQQQVYNDDPVNIHQVNNQLNHLNSQMNQFVPTTVGVTQQPNNLGGFPQQTRTNSPGFPFSQYMHTNQPVFPQHVHNNPQHTNYQQVANQVLTPMLPQQVFPTPFHGFPQQVQQIMSAPPPSFPQQTEMSQGPPGFPQCVARNPPGLIHPQQNFQGGSMHQLADNTPKKNTAESLIGRITTPPAHVARDLVSGMDPNSPSFTPQRHGDSRVVIAEVPGTNFDTVNNATNRNNLLDITSLKNLPKLLIEETSKGLTTVEVPWRGSTSPGKFHGEVEPLHGTSTVVT